MQTIVQTILQEIDALLPQHQPVLIAIDGRCASGKTTLAALLQQAIGCNVVHMDHFFLQPHQCSPQRYAQPGENIDHERFLQEVLLPLTQMQPLSYRPFDCHRMDFGPAIELPAKPVTVIEGSYACHPALRNDYTLRIFLTVDPQVQLERIRNRNGESAVAAFRERWIPLEERYFEQCQVPECCTHCFRT